jgi:peptidoglycan L-alanyl-D-glutamate endopeptidase CwlK
MAKAGYTEVGISSTFRDREHQDWLYGQGRPGVQPHGRPGAIVTNSRGGQSIHNYRLAFDFFRNIKGKTADGRSLAFADRTPVERAFWDTGGRIWREMGGVWGGDWRGFPDRPHCEFSGNLRIRDLIAGRYLPADYVMPWEDSSMRINTIEEVPVWARAFVQGMVDRGELSGTGSGLNITEDMIRCWMVGEKKLLNMLQGKGL